MVTIFGTLTRRRRLRWKWHIYRLPIVGLAVGQIELIVTRDSCHEKAFAEIRGGGKLVALVSQEHGPDDLVVEVPPPEQGEAGLCCEVALDQFLKALRDASDTLVGEYCQTVITNDEQHEELFAEIQRRGKLVALVVNAALTNWLSSFQALAWMRIGCCAGLVFRI